MTRSNNETLPRQYVIGTAGHIDHGKTALVKALTGVDTDRLPEEKKRGITIDIGFAHLNEQVTFIDVPGHERFIKNMVAGVSNIDMVLLVVAADDGVMLQTKEHFDIIRLLDIQHGIIAITKCDLAESDWLELVEADIRELVAKSPFADAPVVRTSTYTGGGIAELRDTLLQTLKQIPPRQGMPFFRMPVDRVFSVKGFGTVVTGTVIGGKIATGNDVELLPQQKVVRIRGLQSHEKDAVHVEAGQRAAVNLAAVDVSEVARGMMLTQPEYFQPATRLNAFLQLLSSAPQPLKTNQRIRLHLHTSEVMARVILPEQPRLNPGESTFVQLRLETPVAAAYRDRFIIRQYSPQHTIGGGIILQVNPPKFRKKHLAIFREITENLYAGDEIARVMATFDPVTAMPQDMIQIQLKSGVFGKAAEALVQRLQAKQHLFSTKISGKTHYFSQAQLRQIAERILDMLALYHRENPGRVGLKEDEIISMMGDSFNSDAVRQALQYSIHQEMLANDGGYFRDRQFSPALSGDAAQKMAAVLKCYREAGLLPPTVKELLPALKLTPKAFKEISRLLREEGALVQISEQILLHANAWQQLLALLREHFRQKESLTVVEFKTLIGATRKHVIPFLEYLDSREYTRREGDVRLPGQRLK
jgi:selenocysteine-specific elongation factor